MSSSSSSCYLYVTKLAKVRHLKHSIDIHIKFFLSHSVMTFDDYVNLPVAAMTTTTTTTKKLVDDDVRAQVSLAQVSVCVCVRHFPFARARSPGKCELMARLIGEK